MVSWLVMWGCSEVMVAGSTSETSSETTDTDGSTDVGTLPVAGSSQTDDPSGHTGVVATTDTGTPPVDEQGWFALHFGLQLDDVVWGDLHTHTHYSQDSALGGLADPGVVVDPSTVYALARTRRLSFSAVADHAEAPVPRSIPSTDPSANVWESTRAMSLAADDAVDDADGLFVPFMGYEYTNPFPCTGDQCPGQCMGIGGNESCDAHGHKNVIFRDVAAAPPTRVSYLDPAVVTASGFACARPRPDAMCGFDTYSVWGGDNVVLWQHLRDGGYAPTAPGGLPSALTIIHTPGNIHHVDWNAIDPDFVRNVEVFSQWGNSEGPPPTSCASQDDLAVHLPPEALNTEEDLIRPQIGQRWLVDGDEAYALSFVGGSDDHSGLPGGDGRGNGGVTGLVTVARGRDAWFDALATRHTLAATWYASTGPAALLFGVEAAAPLLGGDVGDPSADGHVVVRARASEAVDELQLVVDGCTVATRSGHDATFEDDLDPTVRHWIYVRARRATDASDGAGGVDAATAYDQTWSSPVYLRAR